MDRLVRGRFCPTLIFGREFLPDPFGWAIQRPESVGALYRWTGNISSGKKGCSTNACRLDSSKMYHHLNLRRSNLFFGIASVWQGASDTNPGNSG